MGATVHGQIGQTTSGHILNGPNLDMGPKLNPAQIEDVKWVVYG
jgi:hypothetical protein